MATLHDMVMRHALYFEGARKGTARDFSKIVRTLDVEVRRAFQTINVNSFGEMTKAEFNQFMSKLRRNLADVFKASGKDYAKTIKELSRVETKLYQVIFKVDTGSAIKVPTQKRIQSGIRNKEIGASGGNLKKTSEQFMNSSISAIERTIRTGFADKKAVTEVLTEIRGLKSLSYRNGVLSRVNAWADSYYNTTFQHVGSSVKSDISSSYYEEYDWVSVIDEVTTDICTERDGQRYTYGDGPMPPAHYNCRSEIVPVDKAGNGATNQSLPDWIGDQSAEFKRDVFTGKNRSLDGVKPISIEELESKLDLILED